MTQNFPEHNIAHTPSLPKASFNQSKDLTMSNVCFDNIPPCPLIQAVSLSTKSEMRILVASVDAQEDIDNLLIKSPNNHESRNLAEEKFHTKRNEADCVLLNLSNNPKEEQWAFWLSFFEVGMGSGKSAKDGLYRFFFGGHAAYADKISKTLGEIGLTAYAGIFHEAMGLFGKPYPIKNIERYQYYGSSPYAPMSKPGHNSFDEKLLALGEKFKQLPNFEIAACAKLNALESLSKLKSKVMANFPEEDSLNWLAIQIDHCVEKLENTHTKLQINHPYFDFHLLWQLYSEVSNGGLPSFFFNSSGNLAEQTLSALKQHQQKDAAFIFEKALSLFPVSYPFDIESRRKFLLAQGETLEDRLEKLDMDVYLDEIWDLCKNIAARQNFIS